MKKHLIAAAVAAAVAVPAMAQVTISGTLDVRAFNDSKVNRGVNNQKAQGSGGESGDAVDGFSTSQMVFQMSEDLGGGLKATGYFAQRLENTLGARDRYIDLSGGFGGLRVGRFNPSVTAGFLGLSGLASTGNAGSFYNFVTNGNNFAQDYAVPGTSTVQTFDEGSHERDDGTIQYTTPTMMGGLVGTLGFRQTSNNRSEANRNNEGKIKQTYATLVYSAGPLAIGAGRSDRDTHREAVPASAASTTLTAGGAGLVNTEVTARRREGEISWVGGGYDFGVARVNAMFASREVSRDSVKRNDAQLQAVSVTAPFGAITLSGSIYTGEDKGADATADDVDTNGYQLSVRYALSKKTFVYAITGENEVKTSAANVDADDNRKVRQHGMGIVHNF